MKIMICGFAGSGKSTLAKKLGKKYSCDVLHLDSVNFKGNWEERTAEEKYDIVGQFMDTHDSWVIDGNYSKTHYERRKEEADLIILLLFNRFNSLYRVTKRYMRYKGMTRPDLGENNPEKLDWEFVKWVLYKGRSRNTKKKFASIANNYTNKVVIIKNQKQLNAYEKKMGIENGDLSWKTE